MTKKAIDKKLWIGIGISLFFLILLFRKIDIDKLLAAFRVMDYRYLLPAVTLTFISYYFRAVRWKTAFSIIAQSSVPHSMAAMTGR